MDNPEEIDRYLEQISFPRLYQEEIEIMNNANTNTSIKTVIKNLSKNKSPEPDGFTGEFYQTLREELIPIFLKLFQLTSFKQIMLFCLQLEKQPAPKYQLPTWNTQAEEFSPSSPHFVGSLMLAVFHSRLLGQELNDPAIPVLDVNLDKKKIAIRKGVCPSLFIAALFTVTKTWKRSK